MKIYKTGDWNPGNGNRIINTLVRKQLGTTAPAERVSAVCPAARPALSVGHLIQSTAIHTHSGVDCLPTVTANYQVLC